MTKLTIGYAGLTHLGLCSAIGAAVRGFDVVCFSPDAELVGRVAVGDLPVTEPGLDAAYAAHRDRLKFTADAHDLAACAVVYVAVDVPTDALGLSDLSAINGMLGALSGMLNAGTILVMLSQVPPGFT